MNTKKKIALFLIVAITALFSYSAFNGVELGGLKLSSMKEKIDLGLDLAGGVYVVLEAQTDESGESLRAKMEQTRAIVRQRVDSIGVAEPNIVIEGEKRLRVELAGVKDPQEAIEMIGKTALLEFKNPEGEVVVTGENIQNSAVAFQDTGMGEQPVVSIEFDSKGAELFREETARLVALPADQDKRISIVLDGSVISSPNVNSEISDGKAVIEGGFTVESATELSNLISAGALPLEMAEIQSSVIGPTLGLKALEKSVLAGGIGMLIIFLLMIALYRIPGVVASLCLTIYVLIVLNMMSGLGVKLTLPGIAALILSIGMAVDANIIIFERIKEEIKDGKTNRSALSSGFSRAITAVIDSNITTVIAGAVLYAFGTGPIKGFGVTLIIGLVASVFTAVFITKYILGVVVETEIGRSKSFFGA
ncbi:protein translocase subunit SecD [Andreesenia angusta]|uniref:Protein translocase subunit SecD n=1 Tax=Andreesenia angusta TaxID=39480 RepID=A0A1S1V7M3_9FIRM|nr:protein translocase subunit SecD [Andreesenia angusta]OHW62601.1 protein translocase subunit SecD [Andreesenia angusta]